MKIEAYYNTGYDIVNIPDGPDKLPLPFKTYTSIDCLQNYFLTSVTVRSTWSEIQNIDYIKTEIGDVPFFYFVNGLEMLAHDVCKLKLVPDFITSAGGINYLKRNIISGITSRVHIPKAYDNYGEYTEDDPLLYNISRPLELNTSDMLIDNENSDLPGSVTYFYSTIDLNTMGSPEYTKKSITYIDPINPDVKVAIPVIPYIKGEGTSFSINDAGNKSIKVNGVALYEDTPETRQGCNEARMLGLEGAILNHYEIPLIYHGALFNFQTKEVAAITGNGPDNVDTGLAFEYAKVRNKRLLYGKFNRAGIITASGANIEADPEDIYTNTKNITIRARADAQPTGAPYFNFSRLNKHDTTGASFWRGAIPGAAWRDIPLMYKDPSGLRLTTEKYSDHNIQASQRQRWNDADNFQDFFTSSINAVLGAGGLLDGDLPDLTGLAPSLLAPFNALGKWLGTAPTEFAWARQNELKDYLFNSKIKTPELHFIKPLNTIASYTGNGAICYKYQINSEDLIRLDKMLDLYGYKITKNLEPSDLDNRSNFNYIEVNNLTIGGGLPRWFKEGIKEQLKGVRLWHIPPTPDAYLTNN